jgi:hypothetical protein
MDELPEVLTRLTTRLDALESRVALLEHPSEAPAPLPAPAPALSEIQLAPAIAASSFAQSGATFAVLGKAMLGMAGAYLLRAVAESGSFPKLAAVALAIAYAGTWLVWAVRVPVGEWFASTTYAGTSALILAPMLWELTLRFKVLTPSVAAAVLAGFVLAAHALAWKRNLTSIVWVADLATAIAAIALLIATHDMEPFLAALLLMAFLSEAAAYRNRWLSVRPVVAVAVDLAAWTLLYIYASPDRNLADYANLGTAALLAPAIALFLIYGTSVALRTILLRQNITFFETGQAVIAFLLAADAVFRFAPAIGAPVFAAFCLAFSVAGYATIFVVHAITADRNVRVYATWSLALFLLGGFVCLPPLWLASSLVVAAILATSAGVDSSRLTLAFHGLVYLFAAAFASGLLQYAAHAVAGAFPPPPGGITWMIAAAIILCYAIGGQVEQKHWRPQLFHTLSAALAVGSAATVLVSAIVWLTASVITPGSSHVAVIRTLTACALALALAWLGPRWRRIELVWLAYATIAAVAAKLLLEDLRQGHPEFIAASIFLYAVTLILVPQLVRRSTRKMQPAPPPSK